ncbi:hypothetical protein AB0J38_41050 [Streptomyces sp. NPDC050095]|uniref:hypothetical protein n=1 Tax=unclassified Streptomyces TaxID=2593676 RepID=UPI003429419D
MTVRKAEVLDYLKNRSTKELCEDFAELVSLNRRMTWAELAVSDVLFERNELAWIEWQLGGNLFGPELPHKYYGTA